LYKLGSGKTGFTGIPFSSNIQFNTLRVQMVSGFSELLVCGCFQLGQ